MTAPATPYRALITLDAPGGGSWQGCVQNRKTGEWFLGQSRGRADGGEDSVIYRFDRAGRHIDQMTLLNATHIYGMGVTDDSVIWATWNGPDGNDVVTIPYRAGEFHKSQSRQMHVFTDHPADVSLSPTRRWAIVREVPPGQHVEAYRQYERTDIERGRDRQHGRTVTIATSPSRIVQGFASNLSNLYVTIGLLPKSSFRIEKWSLKTGKHIATLSLSSRLGLSADSAADTHREPEGMDGHRFNVVTGHGADRRLTVFELRGF